MNYHKFTSLDFEELVLCLIHGYFIIKYIFHSEILLCEEHSMPMIYLTGKIFDTSSSFLCSSERNHSWNITLAGENMGLLQKIFPERQCRVLTYMAVNYTWQIEKCYQFSLGSQDSINIKL